MAEGYKIHKPRHVPIVEGKVDETPWSGARAAEAAAEALPDPRVERARSGAFNTIEAQKRKAFSDNGLDYLQGIGDIGSGGEYQMPLPPKELFWDTVNSIAPTGKSIVDMAGGMFGDLADSRYTLAHYLNKQMSGGVSENRTANDFLKTMEKYDPVSQIPNTEDVAAEVTDPLSKAMGIDDYTGYQPQGPWGKAVYLSGQAVDPYGAAAKGVNKGAKFLKGLK